MRPTVKDASHPFQGDLMGVTARLSIGFILLLANLAQAQIDDRHLTSGKRFRSFNVRTELQPDAIQTIGPHATAKLHFVRQVKSNWTPISALPVEANARIRPKTVYGRSLGNRTDRKSVV